MVVMIVMMMVVIVMMMIVMMMMTWIFSIHLLLRALHSLASSLVRIDRVAGGPTIFFPHKSIKKMGLFSELQFTSRRRRLVRLRNGRLKWVLRNGHVV